MQCKYYRNVEMIMVYQLFHSFQGDSGGPLVYGGSTLVGVTSFGAAAGCEAGYPDAFSRVSFFREWVRDETGV